MPKTSKSHAKKSSKPFKQAFVWIWRRFTTYWRQSWWHKLIVIVVLFILVSIGTMYGIARWYMWSVRNTPYTMGVTFVPDYATYLGVNPQQTMDALLNDMHVRNFRITSYWSDLEPTPGH